MTYGKGELHVRCISVFRSRGVSSTSLFKSAKGYKRAQGIFDGDRYDRSVLRLCTSGLSGAGPGVQRLGQLGVQPWYGRRRWNRYSGRHIFRHDRYHGNGDKRGCRHKRCGYVFFGPVSSVEHGEANLATGTEKASEFDTGKSETAFGSDGGNGQGLFSDTLHFTVQGATSTTHTPITVTWTETGHMQGSGSDPFRRRPGVRAAGDVELKC